MKSWSTGLSATLMAFGLAVSLTSLAGCGGTTKECSSTDDCAAGQVCNADGQCVTPEDKCAGVSCPGLQTCNADTGACEGACCGPNTCTNPRTHCDETACLAGAGGECVQNTCGEGANLGCPDGYTCNQIDQTCQANCLPELDGCPLPNQICNTETGQCEIRVPDAGEVGAPCTAGADCSAGLQCFPESQIGPGGYCSKSCNSDSECPQGAVCLGICYDACNLSMGDCGPDRQCAQDLNAQGQAVDFCYPFFTESQCTANCLPNGTACDRNAKDQCEAGSACIGWGGDLAFCQKLACDLFDNPCDPGESCEGIGYGMTACFNRCDARDPTACQSLGNDNGQPQCMPSSMVLGADDTYWETADAANCHAGETGTALTIAGQTEYFCHTECSADSDCAAGQFCGQVDLNFSTGDSVSFKSCMNYNVVENSCAAGACSTTGCTDLNAPGFTVAVCYEGCQTDADCTADFGGSCQRLNFRTGDSISLCSYDNSGSICFAGCSTDADCGYCDTDADCGTVRGPNNTPRQQLCDLASHTCQTSLNAESEADSWCRSGQSYDVNAIETADGSHKAGCAYPCNDDLDCAGTCGADHFCQPVAQLCNGPTGQCEDVCSGAAAGADECLFGDCAEGAGPSGVNRCVLGCDADTACDAGLCDESAGYCVLSCNDVPCQAGNTCDTTSGLCVPDPTVDTLTVGGDDVLADNAATVTSGTNTVEWATSNAAATTMETADYQDPCSGVAADAWTADASFPGTASGTYDVDITADTCVRFTATGPNAEQVVTFGVTIAQ